jgi:4-amino-4-deoxy-L-arabinose transferase-like glycosyltransferase
VGDAHARSGRLTASAGDGQRGLPYLGLALSLPGTGGSVRHTRTVPQKGASAVQMHGTLDRTRPPAGASPAPGATGASRGRRLDAPHLVVLVTAVLSALVAMLLSRHLFTYLSVDNDEPIYRLQAQALASGHLFPKAPADPDAYRPWLAVVSGGHYILKYTPVVPGLLALSLLVSGSFLPALGAVAAGTVVATYLLASEVHRDQRVAATAAVLMAASPLVLIQSGLLLPYLPSLLLIELAMWGALRWRRTGGAGPLVAAGFAAGLAVAARPFDAVLLLGPVAVWVLATLPGRRLRLVGGVLAGAVAPLALLLAYDQAATGNPLRMPFNLLEKSDKLGFGARRLFPTDKAHHFGLVDGLAGVGRHLQALGTGWAAGGLLLALAAGYAVRRGRSGGAGPVLAAGGLALVVGYIPFWGAWNAALLWGGIRWIGPFYFTVLLLPLVVLGARGVIDVWVRRRRLALVGLTLAAGLVVVAVSAIPGDVRQTARDRSLTSLLARADGGLVFFDSPRPFLQHPSAVLDNRLQPGGRRVYALLGGARDARVVAAWPGRPTYRLRIYGAYDPAHRSRTVLSRLDHRSGFTVPILASVTLPRRTTSALLVLQTGARRQAWTVPVTTTSIRLVTTAEGTRPLGLTPAPVPATPRADPPVTLPAGEVRVQLQWRRSDVRQVIAEHDDFSVRTGAQGADVLVPGSEVGHFGSAPPPAITVSAG